MSFTTKLSPLSIKTAEQDTGIIEGYASTFNGVDSYGDTIKAGAFAATLAKHNSDGTRIPVLFEHDRALGSHVGEIIDAKEDDRGLFIRAQLDTDTDAGKRAFNLAKGRRIRGMSIGFIPRDVEPGIVDDHPVNTIKNVDLREVSLVLNPADSKAMVTAVKSADEPRRPEVMSRADVAMLAKNLENGTFGTAFTEHAEKGRKAAKESAIRTALMNGDLQGAYNASAGIDFARRAELSEEITNTIITSAKSAGRGLTAPEQHALTKAHHFAQKSHRAADAPDLRAAFRSNGPTTDDNPNYKGDSMHTATDTLAVTTKAHAQVAEKAVNTMQGGDAMQQKAVSATGDITTPLLVSQQVQALEQPALSILELIPNEVIASPTFSYLRQTTRTNNADVVEPGELKPTSDYGFERVDASLEVVAHLASGIDKYILQDTSTLSSFIGAEMIGGVMERVERLVVEALAAAAGAVAQGFVDDIFATTRNALTKLETSGLTPAAFILSPDDWQDVELAKASGSGQFIFGAAPVNQTARTLWGVPVVVSHRQAAGAGYLLAQDSAKLHTDGGLGVAWNSSGDEFARNQMTVRAEGRFKPVVTRQTGVVKMTLAAA